MSPAKHNTDIRSSLDKAFALLKVMPEDNAGRVGVSELARRAQLPKSTAHRLLAALIDNGAVERDGDLYRRRVFFDSNEVVAPTEHGIVVADLLTPFLAALFERTRSTVHLAYLSGMRVIYANKLFSARTITAPSKIGGCVPAHATGVGKALLAWDNDVAEKVIEGGLEAFTDCTITDPDEFRAELARIRREGVAFDVEELRDGLICVAAPVFGRGNRAVAALSVSVDPGRLEVKDIIPVLKQIARTASQSYRTAIEFCPGDDLRWDDIPQLSAAVSG